MIFPLHTEETREVVQMSKLISIYIERGIIGESLDAQTRFDVWENRSNLAPIHSIFPSDTPSICQLLPSIFRAWKIESGCRALQRVYRICRVSDISSKWCIFRISFSTCALVVERSVKRRVSSLKKRFLVALHRILLCSWHSTIVMMTTTMGENIIFKSSTCRRLRNIERGKTRRSRRRKKGSSKTRKTFLVTAPMIRRRRRWNWVWIIDVVEKKKSEHLAALQTRVDCFLSRLEREQRKRRLDEL